MTNKRILSILLTLAISISNLSMSYAWPWDKKKEEVAESDVNMATTTLVDLVKEHSKKVKVNINLPKKIDDKYASYILFAQDELYKYLKNKKVDTELLCFNYANVIWEKEVSKKDEEFLKSKDIIAEYLVCFVYTYADKDKNIKTATSYLLCEERQEQYANMMQKLLEAKNSYQSDQAGFRDIIFNGVTGAGAGAIAGGAAVGAAGTVVPVIGNIAGAGVGAAIGGVGGFLYGAGSTIADNFKKNKISINQVIAELPENVYKENFDLLPSYEKPKVTIVKVKNLSKYLDEKQIKTLTNATKKYEINE